MKLIISRKGFDSVYGRIPSPILPDGTLLSLPIPVRAPVESPIKYSDLSYGDTSLLEIANGLGCKDDLERGAHLDPDLNSSTYGPRPPGWRQLFGQSGAAQTHLNNRGVGKNAKNAMFLFFGWFREAEPSNGTQYRFVRGAPDLHVIYGWLQVDQVLSVPQEALSSLPWSAYHPHLCEKNRKEKPDVLYVAKENLEIKGIDNPPAGGGTFKNYHECLRLTAPGCSRSLWRLPRWFCPAKGRSPLSYHRNIGRLSCGNGCVILQSVAIGQEFVLDTIEYPEAIDWLRMLMSHAA